MDQFTHSNAYLMTYNPLVMSNYERSATMICGIALVLAIARDIWIARRKSAGRR